MDFNKLLEQKKNAMIGVNERINQLENEKMSLAQELFRLEGETRLLNQILTADKPKDKEVEHD